MNDVREAISLDDPRMDRRESDAIPWTRGDLRMLIELNTRIADLGTRHDRQDERQTLALMELTARVASLEATRYQQQGAQQGAALAGKVVQAIASGLWGAIAAVAAIYAGLVKAPP